MELHNFANIQIICTCISDLITMQNTDMNAISKIGQSSPSHIQNKYMATKHGKQNKWWLVFGWVTTMEDHQVPLNH